MPRYTTETGWLPSEDAPVLWAPKSPSPLSAAMCCDHGLELAQLLSCVLEGCKNLDEGPDRVVASHLHRLACPGQSPVPEAPCTRMIQGALACLRCWPCPRKESPAGRLSAGNEEVLMRGPLQGRVSHCVPFPGGQLLSAWAFSITYRPALSPNTYLTY